MRRSDRTALVVFTGDPRREEREKQLPRKFLRQLHGRLQSIASRVPRADLIVASEQSGRWCLAGPRRESWHASSGLASQIEHALRLCFADGYERVILLAGDVIGLSPEILIAAAESLSRKSDEAVIGPSPDGGFYLVGLNRDLSLEWSSVLSVRNQGCDLLRLALTKRGITPTFLPLVEDVDSRADAIRILSRSAVAVVREIRSVLLGLLHDADPHGETANAPLCALLCLQRVRAPPRFAS